MIPMTFKELRKANSLSQAELAAALGISASSVRQYEYGTRKPSDTVLTKIKELYGVDISNAASTPTGEKKKMTTVPTEKENHVDEALLQMQSDAEAAVHTLFTGKTEIIIQSPMGGEITAEQILEKVGPVEKVYVRVDQNALYWVREGHSGAINLW